MDYSVLLIHPSNGPTLWLAPPNEDLGFFYTEAHVIDALIENGLVEKQTGENLPGDADATYHLTEKGTELFRAITDEVKHLPEHERFPAGENLLKRKIKLRIP